MKIRGAFCWLNNVDSSEYWHIRITLPEHKVQGEERTFCTFNNYCTEINIIREVTVSTWFLLHFILVSITVENYSWTNLIQLSRRSIKKKSCCDRAQFWDRVILINQFVLQKSKILLKSGTELDLCFCKLSSFFFWLPPRNQSLL